MCCVLKCISRTSKETKVLWFRVFLFLSYMHAGAFVFMMIEQDATEKQIDENKIRMEILKNITTSKYNMTEHQFNKLIDALKPSLCFNLPEWSYEHANSFTLQLLTTIGYGNITPRTAAGQIVTIVYALLGIPLTVLALKSIGGAYNSMVKCLIRRIENCKRGMQTDIRNLELKVLLLNFLLVASIILSSAAASTQEDSWNLQQGIYVWFITLTTVGFGDFVPKRMISGGQPNGLLIPGLCFMSGVVDAMVEYAYKLDGKVSCCPGASPCSNNTTSSSHGENGIDTVDTQDLSLHNLGFEAAGTEKQTAVVRQETTLESKL